MFDYAIQAKDGEDPYDHTEEWLQEQQTTYKTVKLKELNPDLIGKFRKLNASALKKVLDPKKEAKFHTSGKFVIPNEFIKFNKYDKKPTMVPKVWVKKE